MKRFIRLGCLIEVIVAVALYLGAYSAGLRLPNSENADLMTGQPIDTECFIHSAVDDCLNNALGRILAAMERSGYLLPGLLRPGLSDRDRQAVLADFPWQLPRELHRFYAWRDGVAEGAKVAELFPGGTMLTLSEAMAIYKLQIETAARIATLAKIEPDKLWSSRWFPVFVSHGDFYVVEGSDRPIEVSPVYFITNEDRIPVRRYASLSDMMEIVARCFEQGAFRVGDSGILQEDIKSVAAITAGYRVVSNRAPEIGNMSEIERLVHILASADGEARGEAAGRLMELHDEAAIPLLAQVIRSADPSARELATRVLAELGGDSAVPPLLNALKDPEESVRGEAAAALGQLRRPQAVDALIVALDDPATSVRMRAVWALGELKAHDAAVKLEAHLKKEEHIPLRNAIIQALGKIGDTSVIPALIEFVKESPMETRILAAAALGELGGDEAAGALRFVVEEQDRLEQTNSGNMSLDSIIKLQQARQLKLVSQQSLAKIDKGRK
ncbi:HEAT repeat domain-containing protein [Methylocaldum sp. GT1BB]|uniref:HEAT repeat domain-containing protein n=1 Tax=Methylocaldum sp. GT1BB TaxID=3438963 RepID=UPI003DA08594